MSGLLGGLAGGGEVEEPGWLVSEAVKATPTATERSTHGEHAPRSDPRPEPTPHTARRAGAKPR